MALKALSIIKEEIARAKANTPFVRHALLDALGVTITERIEKECIEQPDPDVDVVDCGEFTVEVEVDTKAELRDHMRKGGDPATFKPTVCHGASLLEVSDSTKCTWGNCGADAVDTFWVQEPGEFRNSKEDLCEVCAGSLPQEGIRVEVVAKGPVEHCRFCGSTREHCQGGNEREDGGQAHDFTPLTPEDIHPLDDVPF